MIKAIIFDCFGVLTTDSWSPFKYRHFGHSKQLMEEVSNFFHQVDAGLADYDEFLGQLVVHTGLDKEVIRAELDKNVANDPLFEMIKNLKKDYQIGMLSNAGDNWLGQLFRADQISLFDAICLSYETGVIKPQPDAYHNIASKLAVDLEECVFVDDQPRYCAAARDVGMQAIEYRDFAQLKAELSQLLDRS